MRATLWLVLGLPIVVAVIVVHKGAFDPVMITGDARMVVEELALLVTAASAALAAFQSTVPGASRRWFWVPFAALALWLATVGQACVEDFLRLGLDGLSIRLDSDCVVPLLLIGPLPAAMLVVMLRRGAPLAPRLTFVLAGIAVAALANTGLRVFHVGDVSIMVLVWHVGLVAVFACVAAWLGPIALRWRHPANAIA